jgi:hypothetical protein
VNLTQEEMQLHNLLALPCLPPRPTQGRKQLVDYFKSHVVTSIEYLGILLKKQLTKQQQKNTIKQSKGRGRKIKPKKQQKLWLEHN